MNKAEKFRPYTCCFTGHRFIPEKEKAPLAARLRETVISLMGQGYVYFGAGGAMSG